MIPIPAWTFHSAFSFTDMHERLSQQVPEITWTVHESEAYGGTYLHGNISPSETVKIVSEGGNLWEMEWWGNENPLLRERIFLALEAADITPGL